MDNGFRSQTLVLAKENIVRAFQTAQNFSVGQCVTFLVILLQRFATIARGQRLEYTQIDQFAKE